MPGYEMKSGARVKNFTSELHKLETDLGATVALHIITNFRVARFFLVQHTNKGKIYQQGENIPNDNKLYQMTTNVPNGRKLNHCFHFQGLQKNQNCDFYNAKVPTGKP
jgi:hypothetical protein